MTQADNFYANITLQTLNVIKNLTRLVAYIDISWNSCLDSSGRPEPWMSANNRIVSIVDDDLATTKLFHEALSENIDNVNVVSFTDPVIALEHFSDNKDAYALVIADLRMPGLNGLELLKKVKTSNPKVRTILMSAYNFEEDILFLKYMEEGTIDSTIDKPVTMNRLYQRVRDELQTHQLTTSK